MNKITRIGYIIIVVAFLAIAAPFTCGWFYQREYQHQLNALNAFNQIHVELISYQRGWWHSKAVIDVRINTKTIQNILTLPAKIHFTLQQEIQHGPILFSGQFLPAGLGLALVNNTMTVISEGHRFSVIKANSYGHGSNSDGSLSAKRDIHIQFLQMDGEIFGPLHAEVSAQQLNASAIADLVDVYSSYLHEGEVYQGQLRSKLMILLPHLFNPGSQLVLDHLTLETPQGQLRLQGKIMWPKDSPATPEDMNDFSQNLLVMFTLSVPKSLVEEVLSAVATLPYINEYSPAEQRKFMDLQDGINVIFQQNSLLIGQLTDLKLLSDSAGEQLMLLERDHDLADRYLANIQTLYLNKDISKETAYLLLFQFSQLQRQVTLTEDVLTQHRQATKDQLFNQLHEWIKRGYITSEHNDYIIELKKAGDKIKLNGKNYQE